MTMHDNSNCFECVHACQALRYYYEHMSRKFEYKEKDGERASVIVDVMLSTISRYVMLKQCMGIDDIELAFRDTIEAFEEGEKL
jgi:hypothetical protein